MYQAAREPFKTATPTRRIADCEEFSYAFDGLPRLLPLAADH
jgi:hypothetical protein